MKQVLFFHAVVVNIAVSAGRIHADPDGIYLLDTIIILTFKFPFFLRRNKAAGIEDGPFHQMIFQCRFILGALGLHIDNEGNGQSCSRCAGMKEDVIGNVSSFGTPSSLRSPEILEGTAFVRPGSTGILPTSGVPSMYLFAISSVLAS